MTRFGPEFAGEVLPGGYAVLGAAAMAAGVTRTISSAVLVFELTSGLQHMLPILVAVIMAYIVGQCYSPSIFDSILGIKGLVTMPEFNHFETYAKTAAQARSLAAAGAGTHNGGNPELVSSCKISEECLEGISLPTQLDLDARACR
eukprot:376577-Pleurochrysis_carterae.AAC.2